MLPFEDHTIYTGVATWAESRGSELALIGDGRPVSYAKLLARARRIAGGLQACGISTDDPIALWVSNRPEWITTQLAAAYIGAPVVAANTRYRTHELEYMLTDAECVAIITESSFLGTDYLELLASIEPGIRTTPPDQFKGENTSLHTVITVDGTDAYAASQTLDSITAPVEEPPLDDPHEPAAIFYTSGTTGEPKGCVHTHYSLVNHSANAAQHIGLTESDSVLGVLPFPGIWGYNIWLGTLISGATLVVQRQFTPTRTAQLVSTHNVSCFPGLATMVLRTVNTVGTDWTQSLKKGVVGFLTESYSPDRFDHIESALGFPIIQPYGLSEGNSMIFVGDPSDDRTDRQLVGGPLVSNAIEAKIIDPESGEPCDDGDVGELHIRGYNIMNGYLGKPAESAEAIDEDGWLHTGDLCVKHGKYFEFQSRIDDALRVRGFLVSPREIEVVIDEIPGVLQSQVVGITDNEAGEEAVAFIRASEGEPDCSAESIYETLHNRLADYKIPRHIEFVPEFPRIAGPHGEKIQKQELAARAKELINAN